MHTCISSHGLKRSWRSCPRRVNAGNKNTPSTHHPRRPNVTTLMVGLKKRSHTQKSHPKVVNPRDTAGERKKKKKKKKNHWYDSTRRKAHGGSGTRIHACQSRGGHLTPGPTWRCISEDRSHGTWSKRSFPVLWIRVKWFFSTSSLAPGGRLAFQWMEPSCWCRRELAELKGRAALGDVGLLFGFDPGRMSAAEILFIPLLS